MICLPPRSLSSGRETSRSFSWFAARRQALRKYRLRRKQLPISAVPSTGGGEKERSRAIVKCTLPVGGNCRPAKLATDDTAVTNVLDNLRVVAELGCPVKETGRYSSIAEPRLDPNSSSYAILREYPTRSFLTKEYLPCTVVSCCRRWPWPPWWRWSASPTLRRACSATAVVQPAACAAPQACAPAACCPKACEPAAAVRRRCCKESCCKERCRKAR